MGLFEVISRLVVLIAVIAGICLHPALQEHRTKLYTLLTTTCPMHWFDGILPSSNTAVHDIDNLRTFVKSGNDVILTMEELALYDGGENSKGLYIALMGLVYNVAAGERFYGKGQSYGFFAGKDGTRAFITGEFNEAGLVADVTGLTDGQMLELLNWVKFYEKTYIYVGKVVGNFYDVNGSQTAALIEAQQALERALDGERLNTLRSRIFPPCNSQWSDSAGTTVWCTDKSGGIERQWIGVPRKYFDSQSKSTRCVCVRSSGPPSDWSAVSSSSGPSTNSLSGHDNGDLDHPNLREYEGCDPEAETCKL